MKRKKIYFFIGTTAEFIKLAPVIKELKSRNIPFTIITSGQNKINFQDLAKYCGNISADIALPDKPHQSSIPLFIFWGIKTFTSSLFSLRSAFSKNDKKNTYLIVHGDTASSLMGACIAKMFGLKLIHVEAGLRSFNFLEPFPEEICRFIINYLSYMNFCQNDWSLNNLKHVPSIKVNTKENTLIEAFWWAIKRRRGHEYAKRFKKYYILIMHRQEHVYFNKQWTRDMLKLVINNADKNLNCVFIMHALTSRFLKSESLNVDSQLGKRILLVPKLPYPEFMTLMNNAEFLATDGCTNQEEVYYMGLPCLALRHRTERIEGLNENVVISKGNKKIIKAFLKNYKNYRRKPVHIKTKPSKIIVDYIVQD